MSDSTGGGHVELQDYLGVVFPVPDDTLACDYPIDTWVTVDGVVVPCTPDDLRVGQPTIQDGLSFGWGRDTTIDQPDTNTCSFMMREELDPRWLGENVIEDPTFSDPAQNLARFPVDWPISDGGVSVGGLQRDETIIATNYYPDPGHEHGAAPYTEGAMTSTDGAGTLELDTTEAHSGLQSFKATTTAPGVIYKVGTQLALHPSDMGAAVGDMITFSGWVKVDTGSDPYGSNDYVFGMTGTAGGTSQYAVAPEVRDEWAQVWITFPVVDVDGTMIVRMMASANEGGVVHWDDFGIALGSMPVDFNGDNPPAGTALEYRWQGTPGASASERYIPGSTGNADSIRVWLIGDRKAAASSSPPAGKAPDNGAMPVVPGQTFHMSVMVTTSVDRPMRWQINTYDADGKLITNPVRFYPVTQDVTANTPTELAADYLVPEGVYFLAAAVLGDGGYGGNYTITAPDFYTTDTVSTLDFLHVGSKIEVWCSANVPAVGSEVMADTGFSGYSDKLLPDERWLVVTSTGAGRPDIPPPINTFGGSDPAVWMIRRDVYDDWGVTAVFAPAPFSDGTDADPDAWDLVPKLPPDTTWHLHAHVWVPPLTTVTLTAYAFDGPHKGDRLSGACPITTSLLGPTSVTGTIAEMQGDSGWYDLYADITLPASATAADGAWIAPGITIDELPSPLTWEDTPGTWAQQTLRWVDLQRVGIDLISLEQESASVRSELIWSGEVGDMTAQSAGNCAYTVSVTASDLSSILQNIKVGDEPWPQETVAARAAHIMALIPQAPDLVIDAGLQDTLVSYRDVDAQPPLGLLQDLAQTAGGVLWITAHATLGAYLWMEDPRTRTAARRFIIDPDTGAVSISEGNDPIGDIAVISAMDILRDPVNWVQNASSVVTQASISWMEEVPPTETGEQTTTQDHTEVVQDTPDVIEKYGIRDASLGTELTTAEDARELAGRILALTRGVGWKVSGLEYDTLLLVRDIETVDYPTRLNIVLDLLDATTRIGYPITLVDMPTWTPAGAVRSMYVEGGTWTWDGRRWHLAITATPSAGQGISARWQDFGGTGVTWNDFRPNQIRWLDAYGTGGPVIEQDHQLQEASSRG